MEAITSASPRISKKGLNAIIKADLNIPRLNDHGNLYIRRNIQTDHLLLNEKTKSSGVKARSSSKNWLNVPVTSDGKDHELVLLWCIPRLKARPKGELIVIPTTLSWSSGINLIHRYQFYFIEKSNINSQLRAILLWFFLPCII